MNITCTAYRASVLASGRIQLTIDDARQDPAEDRLLIPQIAQLLKMHPTTVYRLSVRRHNPLPLIRGKGRPYSFRSLLNQWLTGTSAAEKLESRRRALRVFGS